MLSRIVCCGDAINRDGRKGGSACRRYCSGCSIVVPCDLLVDVAVSLTHRKHHRLTQTPHHDDKTNNNVAAGNSGTVSHPGTSIPQSTANQSHVCSCIQRFDDDDGCCCYYYYSYCYFELTAVLLPLRVLVSSDDVGSVEPENVGWRPKSVLLLGSVCVRLYPSLRAWPRRICVCV